MSKEIRFGEVKSLDIQKLIHRTGGGITKEPKIIKKESIKLIGKRGSYTLEKNNIPGLWNQFFKQMNRISSIADGGTYGVSIYKEENDIINIEDDFNFDYLVGFQVESLDLIPKGMVGYEIPAMDFAVFTHRGLIKDLQDTYDYIYRTWLPSSEYYFVYAEHFEYRKADFKDSKDSETYIYIPISKE